MDHTENTPFPAVALLLRVYLLQWECVYRAVAQKRSLFTESLLSNGAIHHNTKLLMLFREIADIYCENYMKLLNTLHEQMTVFLRLKQVIHNH
jgi:hypothetical protein